MARIYFCSSGFGAWCWWATTGTIASFYCLFCWALGFFASGTFDAFLGGGRSSHFGSRQVFEGWAPFLVFVLRDTYFGSATYFLEVLSSFSGTYLLTSLMFIDDLCWDFLAVCILIKSSRISSDFFPSGEAIFWPLLLALSVLNYFRVVLVDLFLVDILSFFI